MQYAGYYNQFIRAMLLLKLNQHMFFCTTQSRYEVKWRTMQWQDAIETIHDILCYVCNVTTTSTSLHSARLT